MTSNGLLINISGLIASPRTSSAAARADFILSVSFTFRLALHTKI
jgi:hypothetical protein